MNLLYSLTYVAENVVELLAIEERIKNVFSDKQYKVESEIEPKEIYFILQIKVFKYE